MTRHVVRATGIEANPTDPIIVMLADGNGLQVDLLADGKLAYTVTVNEMMLAGGFKVTVVTKDGLTTNALNLPTW